VSSPTPPRSRSPVRPPPRSRLPTWSTRALSTTAPRVTRPRLSQSRRRHPRPPPRPRPIRNRSRRPSRFSRRSSDALHPAPFAPLRRPRLPIVLCYGEPGRAAARAGCAELSAQGFCRAARVRRARAGRVPEDAGALLEARARDLAQHRRRGGVRHVRPAVRVSPSVHVSRADAVPTGRRQSSSARRSSTAPSPRACTAAA
jgi:hypothetical protein